MDARGIATPLPQRSQAPTVHDAPAPPLTTAPGTRNGHPISTVDEITVLEDALQQNWAELGYRHELAAYYGSSRWKSARSVLDIGTGNGRYLSEIANRFPDKHYLGIDRSRALLDRAAVRYGWNGLELGCVDLHGITGGYDAVVMRLVLSEVTGTRSVLDKIADITNVGGAAFIIEVLDCHRYFEPIPRRAVEFLDSLAAEQRSMGGDSAVALNLVPMVRSHDAWDLGASIDVILPSTLGDNLRLLKETCALTFKISEIAGGLDFDYESLHEAWRWWCDLKHQYMQTALRVIRLDRI